MISKQRSASPKSGATQSHERNSPPSVATFSSNVAAYDRSTGAKPRSALTAQRSVPRSSGSGAANERPSIGVENGSSLSKAACAESSRQASATVRAIGPWTESGDQPNGRPFIGTVPGDGRNPTTPA